MPKEAWAWEFTRRNPSYILAWEKNHRKFRDQKNISKIEMNIALNFGLLAFFNPDLKSINNSVFWSPNIVPNILKCSLIKHTHNEFKDGVILADLDLRLTYIRSEDGFSHLLLKDNFSSLQLIFDVELDLNTFFDFEIHLPAYCNLSKQIKSAIKLDQLLSCQKFKNIHGLSVAKSNQYIEILFAYDLLKLGYRHSARCRGVARNFRT